MGKRNERVNPQRKRTRYTKEFKLEAVRLLELGEKAGAQLALELGVARNQIYKWQAQLRAKGEGQAFLGPGAKTVSDQSEIERLQRELRRATEERDILKKGRSVLCEGVAMRYGFIREHAHAFAVATLCRVLRVSRSGYYDWRTRTPSQRMHAKAQLLVEIERVHKANYKAYGAVKTWEALNQTGIICGKHRVARLRREAGIGTQRRRRFRIATEHRLNPLAAPDLIERRFSASEPNRAWVGDMTFVRTRQGWLYLTTLLDLYSRRIVGWAMGERPDKALVLNALEMAIQSRRPGPGLIHHTDQGMIYRGTRYRKTLQSVGRAAKYGR